MIVLVRLEADGETLEEVVKDIEQATKALKLGDGMRIHDEHYERVHDSCYKGRRVFKVGVKGAPTNQVWWTASSGTAAQGGISVQPGIAVSVPPHPRQKSQPRAKK